MMKISPSIPPVAGAPREDEHPRSMARLRSGLHRELMSRIDWRSLESLDETRVRDELRRMTEGLIDAMPVALNEAERRELVGSIQNEILGLGPLEPLLKDGSVSDILVNGPYKVYVERHGRLEPTAVRFDDDAHLLRAITRIVSRVGRRIDESSPMVDARLADGGTEPLTLRDLVALHTLTPGMAELLGALVRARLNLLVSGGTGTGKTTLLNVLSAAIPPHERVVTIEDSAELQLQQPHVVRLETRPPNIEGKGEVNQRVLVHNSLRMRPDRIVLGEVRGSEVLDMLQAMNTGHEGSMTTIHANSPRDALTRLEHMMGMAGLQTHPLAMRQQITSAISVVLQVTRLSDGRRKITSVQEITGMEGEAVSMQEIFQFEQTGLSGDGLVLGRFRATGIRPRFMQRLRACGIALPESLFDPSLMVA
ncbi:MAG: CpaF family protein [Betaproteobacteria bacterium]|nr:CpaF family protein [Betaproteobacteria bacterium]